MRYVRKYKEETDYSGDLDRIFIDHTISGVDSPKKELVKEVKPIASYRCYDKTNDDSGRDILEDLTGNGHDLRLYNFSYALDSGYGAYWANFSNWTGGDESVIINNRTAFSVTFRCTSDTPRNRFQGKILSSKICLRISGLTGSNTVSVSYWDGSYMNYLKEEMKNGIYKLDNIPLDQILYYIYTTQKDVPVTIEQIPEYKGALVSDGVDDYGICDNFPILTKDKGYTILALRKWIGLDKYSCFLSNAIRWIGDINELGAFVVEKNTNSKTSVSFGSETDISTVFNNDDIFIYQSSISYNGKKDIRKKDGVSSNESFVIFCADTTVLWASSIALYALEIYDYDLTELEIKKAKDRLLLEYYSKTYSPIAAWSAYGKYNWEKDNNILKDITGNGHDLTLNNFSWKLDSGYGIYWDDFNDWIGGNNDVFVDSKSQNSITFHYFQSSHNRVQGKIFSNKIIVRISNLNPGETISFAYYNENVVVYLKEKMGNGVFKIDNIPLDGLLYYFYTTQKNTPVTIEQIPEYQGSLVFDGVDDYGVCNIPELKDSDEYTIIMRRKLIDLESLNKSIVCGYGTSSGETLAYNHFWLEYLNCGWEGGKNLTSSMGDILYLKDEDIPEEITYQTSNSYNGIQINDTGGSLEKRGDIFFLGGLGNGYNTKMAFYSAYLFDRNLTEEEIEYFIRANINKNYRLPSK